MTHVRDIGPHWCYRHFLSPGMCWDLKVRGWEPVETTLQDLPSTGEEPWEKRQPP